MERPPKKLYEHVCRVFSAMRQGSTYRKLVIDGEEVQALIWEGHTTKLIRDLGLPSPYYSSVMTRLLEMGCIRQLSRGGGSAQSRWELIDDPSLEAFYETEPERGQTRLGAVEDELVTLRQKMENMEARLADTGS